MTLLAAGFAAKGLLIVMTSSSVATGLAQSKRVIWSIQMLRDIAIQAYNYPVYMIPNWDGIKYVL